MQYKMYAIIGLILVSSQAVFCMYTGKTCGRVYDGSLCFGSDDESESFDDPMSLCLFTSDWYWFNQSNKGWYSAASELMATFDRSLVNSHYLKDLLKHPEIIAMMSEEAQNALKPWIQQPNNEKEKRKNEKTQNKADNNIPPKSFKREQRHKQRKVLD